MNAMTSIRCYIKACFVTCPLCCAGIQGHSNAVVMLSMHIISQRYAFDPLWVSDVLVICGCGFTLHLLLLKHLTHHFPWSKRRPASLKAFTVPISASSSNFSTGSDLWTKASFLFQCFFLHRYIIFSFSLDTDAARSLSLLTFLCSCHHNHFSQRSDSSARKLPHVSIQRSHQALFTVSPFSD